MIFEDATYFLFEFIRSWLNQRAFSFLISLRFLWFLCFFSFVCSVSFFTPLFFLYFFTHRLFLNDIWFDGWNRLFLCNFRFNGNAFDDTFFCWTRVQLFWLFLTLEFKFFVRYKTFILLNARLSRPIARPYFFLSLQLFSQLFNFFVSNLFHINLEFPNESLKLLQLFFYFWVYIILGLLDFTIVHELSYFIFVIR